MVLPVVEKGVDGKFAIGLELQSPDLEAGQEITAVETSVSPVGLTLVGSPTISTDKTKVYQIVDGGVAGTDYTIQFKITTSAGYVYEHPVLNAIKVEVVK